MIDHQMGYYIPSGGYAGPVQGKYHMTFVQKHFPLLKKTVEKVVEVYQVSMLICMINHYQWSTQTKMSLTNWKRLQIQTLKIMQGYGMMMTVDPMIP